MTYHTNSTIDLTKGILYENRTLKYLTPSLKDWGTDLTYRVNRIPALAWCIGDANMSDTFTDDTLYMLTEVDSDLSISFHNFLEWFQDNEFYSTDYEYDEIDGNKHMLVFKIPENHEGIVSRFIKGKYSSLYSDESLKRLFSRIVKRDGKEYYNERLQILEKDPKYRERFKKQLVKDFNYFGEIDSTSEFDYPPILSEEIFNYESL